MRAAEILLVLRDAEQHCSGQDQVSRAQDDQASRKQVWNSQGTHGPKSGEEFPEQVRPPELGQGLGCSGVWSFPCAEPDLGRTGQASQGGQGAQVCLMEGRIPGTCWLQGDVGSETQAETQQAGLEHVWVGRGGTRRWPGWQQLGWQEEVGTQQAGRHTGRQRRDTEEEGLQQDEGAGQGEVFTAHGPAGQTGVQQTSLQHTGAQETGLQQTGLQQTGV